MLLHIRRDHGLLLGPPGSARQIRCPLGQLGEISFRRFRRAHYRITV
jgi:hypothetical protein